MQAIQITYAIISMTSFLLGVIIGWVTAHKFNVENTIRKVMALVLLAVYVISVIAEIRLPEYQTPMLLHTIMGAMIGYLFSQDAEVPFKINIGR